MVQKSSKRSAGRSVASLSLCATLIILISFIIISPSIPRYMPIIVSAKLDSSSKTQINCCGPGCRKPTEVATYYDDKYFKWQIEYGKIHLKQKNWDLFYKTTPNLTVADFGAGGGFILSSLRVRKKIAIEINDVARKYIQTNSPDIITYKYPEEVPTESVDLVISHHAAEHMECPITEFREIHRSVKAGGRIVVGVPNEGINFAIEPSKSDVHQHFYTWNRQNLFNTMQAAGFEVEEMDPPIYVVLRIMNYSTWRLSDANMRNIKPLDVWGRGRKKEQ